MVFSVFSVVFIGASGVSAASFGRTTTPGLRPPRAEYTAGDTSTVRITGRLREHASFWRTFVRSSVVMQWIDEGYSVCWGPSGPPPSIRLPNHSSVLAHSDFVDTAVAALLAACAARERRTPAHCSLPLMVDSSKEKKRLIWNGKWLNSFLVFDKFKYEELSRFVETLFPGDALFYWDYKSGYYHVELHESSRQYIGFEWAGRFYEYCALPFGLAPACLVFTKINKELVGKWRGEGKRIHPYVDDFCVAVRAPSLLCPAALGVMRSMLRDVERAGWVIEPAKSQLYLSRSLVHVGVGIDLVSGFFFISEKAWAKLQSCISQIRSARRGRVPLRLLGRFTGLVISHWFVLGHVCRIFTRYTYGFITAQLELGGWSRHVEFSQEVLSELEFFQHCDRSRFYRAIWEPQSAFLFLQESVHSDASDIGWGAWLAGVGDRPVLEAQSYLLMEDRDTSSLRRELLGAEGSLLSFENVLRSRRVVLVCDNMGLGFVMFGGSRIPACHEIVVRIFWWCLKHSVILETRWVPREEAVRADLLSKIRDHDDWMLNPRLFRSGPDRRWGPHTFDRFASNLNALLERFNSARYCPGTSGVDSFAQSDWREFNNWCNPPFRLLGRLLLFLQEVRAAATITFPVWQKQSWWPLLCPDGVHFADCVVGWMEVGRTYDTFLPGLGRANQCGVGLPDFRVIIVRVSFHEDEVPGEFDHCLHGGCARCAYGQALSRGLPFLGRGRVSRSRSAMG